MNLRGRATTLLLISVMVVAMVGGWYAYQWNARLLRIGDYRVDPQAKLDPTRRYDILVWEHDVFVPGVSEEQRHAALEAAAAELADVYPNITVQFAFIPADRVVEHVLEAFEAGVGPDIVGLSGGGILIDPARQVPVTPYMTEEGLADLLPSVATAIRKDAHMWAWPRWVSLSMWIGHRVQLGTIQGLPALTSADLMSQANAWKKATSNRPPIAYNALDIDFIYGILVATTGHSLLSDSGEIRWTQQQLEQSAQFLYRLVADGLASKDVQSVARNRLHRFWDAEAALIAPAGYPILHHAVSRLGELTHDPDNHTPQSGRSQLVITSPAVVGDYLNGAPGRVASYAVFLREQHAGDDHTLAAMLVAQHLSRRAGYWEAANMLTIPAYASSLAQWERDSGLMQEHVQALGELARRLVTPPVGGRWARLEEEAMAQVVLPPVAHLMQGDLTPEAFAAAVWRDLQAFISARVGK